MRKLNPYRGPVSRAWKLKRMAAAAIAPNELSAINGTLAATLAAATLAATGSLSVNAQSAPTLGAITLASTASLKINAAAAITLGAATSAGAGSLALDGRLNHTLGEMMATSAGSVSNNAQASATLDALTLAAPGSISINAQLAATLDALMLAAAGIGTVPAIEGVLNATLDALACMADATMPAIQREAVGGWTPYHKYPRIEKIPVQAEANITLEDAVCVSTAELRTAEIKPFRRSPQARRREEEILLAA